jgi:hypothetical protein
MKEQLIPISRGKPWLFLEARNLPVKIKLSLGTINTSGEVVLSFSPS